VGIKVSGSIEITTTYETILFVVPDPYVAFLRRLSVTNKGTSPATIQIKFYNGDASKVVLNIAVVANETVVLREDELPLEGCPTKITVTSDVAPYRIDWSVELE